MAIQPKQDGYDEAFSELTQPQLDPVQFLNDILPTLTLSSQPSTTKQQQRTATLQSTSAELQTILSRLSAHSVRSSAELTSLTDEILRSGNRLAYEVEVLRGDVNGLYELLTDSLKEEINRFVTQEIKQESLESEDAIIAEEDMTELKASLDPAVTEPDFIRQLHLLGTVKSRLEGVVASFGEALKWPIPPSEVSMASSLISVSAPELGMVNSAEDDKAREYTRKLRNEIIGAMESEGGGYAGLEVATKKVNDLRAVSQIWKGTAEEKARTRVVEGLTKLVEDRKKQLDSRSGPPRTGTEGNGPRSSSTPGRSGRIVEGSTTTAAGLFRNLQKLRDEMYLD